MVTMNIVFLPGMASDTLTTEVVIDGLLKEKVAALDVVDLGEKKRGVVAKQHLGANEFVAKYKTNAVYPRLRKRQYEEEYKTNAVYPRLRKRQYEEEYKMNQKGSYILEAQPPPRGSLIVNILSNNSTSEMIHHHGASLSKQQTADLLLCHSTQQDLSLSTV